MEIMNRAAGMADEMGTFVHTYLKEFENAVRAGVINENEVYSYILEQIEKCDDNGIKINIINKIKRAQKYKELMSGPEMFEDILKNM